MATLEEITKLMAIMSVAFPGKDLPKATIKLYAEVLKDLPEDVLEAASNELIASSNFFPTVAEWRGKSIDLMIGKHNIPTAAEAWEEAIDHCRHGRYTDYSHPLIEKASMSIGVEYWRTMTIDQEMATRAHFMKIYESQLIRELENIKMLPGSKSISERYQQNFKALTSKLSMDRALASGKVSND